MKDPRDRFWLACFGLAWLGVVLVAWQLAGYDLATYPYKFADSFDWLVNGLHYAGETQLSLDHRPPLLPWSYGVLFILGLEDWIPWLPLLSLAGSSLLLFALMRSLTSIRFACVGLTLFLTNHAVLGSALFVGADVVAVGLQNVALLLLLHWVRAGDPRYLYGGAGVVGLSFLCQHSAQFLWPALLLGLVCSPRPCRRLLTSPHTYGAMAVSAAVVGVGFALRWALTGVFYVEEVRHLSLVRPHLDSIPFYAWGQLSFFSVPVVALFLVGLVAGSRSPCQRERQVTLFLACVASVYAAFFVLLYDWNDVRFIIYWALPVFFVAGRGLLALWDRLLGQRAEAWRRLAGGLLLGVVLLAGNVYATAAPWTPSLALPGDWNMTLEGRQDLEAPATLQASTERSNFTFYRGLHRELIKDRARQAAGEEDWRWSRDVAELGRAVERMVPRDQTVHLLYYAYPWEYYIHVNAWKLASRREVDVRVPADVPARERAIVRRSALDREGFPRRHVVLAAAGDLVLIWVGP